MGKKLDQLLTGAGIGFLVGGPLGAIFGAVLAGGLTGSHKLFGADKADDERVLFYSHLTVLLTLVAKADGKVSPQKVQAITDFFEDELHFGAEELQVVQKIMKKTMSINPSPESVAKQFVRVSTLEERLALLRLLWMVAGADGLLDKRTERVIIRIGQALGIEAADQRAAQAEFFEQEDRNYAILGVDPAASDEEIKKAYRRMAKKFHPDRVAHLGEEYARLAEEKFATISAAYGAIREERGF